MPPLVGKVSWFGGPHDPEDSGHTASGGTTAEPGIAVYNHGTLGGYWRVRANNGKTAILRQTDIGPAPWTGRKIDVTYSALKHFGYNEGNFPTDATFRAEYLGKNAPKGGAAGMETQQGANAPARQQLSVQQGGGPDPQLIAALEAALRPPPQAPVAAQAQLARPAHSAGPTMPEGARAIPPLSPAPEPSMADKLQPLLEQITSSMGESKVVATGNSGPEHALTNAVPHGSKLAGFLPGNAQLAVKRIDQGQDIQTNAGGPILAPGTGYVVDVKDNPGGFGNRYPIVHFTSGPLAGHDVYIGHTHSALPKGAHFSAGAVLSHTGHGTSAEGNARTPGWAEIGLWSGGPGDMQAGKKIAPLLGLR